GEPGRPGLAGGPDRAPAGEGPGGPLPERRRGGGPAGRLPRPPAPADDRPRPGAAAAPGRRLGRAVREPVGRRGRPLVLAVGLAGGAAVPGGPGAVCVAHGPGRAAAPGATEPAGDVLRGLPRPAPARPRGPVRPGRRLPVPVGGGRVSDHGAHG